MEAVRLCRFDSAYKREQRVISMQIFPAGAREFLRNGQQSNQAHDLMYSLPAQANRTKMEQSSLVGRSFCSSAWTLIALSPFNNASIDFLVGRIGLT